MAHVVYVGGEGKETKKVFWQDWGEDQPGEPAILIEGFSNEISLVQDKNNILISRHELKVFIKKLQKII